MIKNKLIDLVDLTRYLSSSPAIPESIHVQTVEHSDPVGKLSQQKFVENDLVPENMRVPRITNATWRTENGGTANFVHGVVLHGESISWRELISQREITIVNWSSLRMDGN